jgi:Peptide methionine sulfoxide reductase
LGRGKWLIFHDLSDISLFPNSLSIYSERCSCYWGTEKYIVIDFQKRFPNSIHKASVGFMSPNPNAVKNPSYRQVCSGTTSHVEVLHIELNDPDTHFEELIKFFFMFHGRSIFVFLALLLYENKSDIVHT